MRTLGLIGGMSWQSTALYYKLINEAVSQRLGGHHSARLIIHSCDFEPIKALQYSGRWDDAGEELAAIAIRLERAGADAILLATNTMHKVADRIAADIKGPFLHIADCTADRILDGCVRRVVLLGTRFTMEEAFYKERLERRGINALVPSPQEIAAINTIIYDELCHGRMLGSSRTLFLKVIAGLMERGAEGVILGCTEIGMLIGPQDVAAPVFDTTAIHAEAAAAFAIGKMEGKNP